MKDSVIRTIAILLYNLLITLGIKSIGVDEAWVQTATALVATAIVYVAIRFAEAKKAWFGWLLGSPKQPVYVSGEVIETAKEAVKKVEADETPAAGTVAIQDPDQPVVEVDTAEENVND